METPWSRDGKAISAAWNAAAITAGTRAETDQVSDVRSSDARRAKGGKKTVVQ